VRYAEALTLGRKWKDIYYIPHSLEYVKRVPQESLQNAKRVIDKIRESKNLDQGTHIICYVGGLTSNKRPDIAVSALAHMIRMRHSAILLVIGDGPLRLQLERLARYLKIQERVVFLGSQPQYVTIGLVSNCSGLVFPSLSEGFSMAIAEALAVGCPVISYAHETAIELARNGGIALVYKPDPQKFAEKTIVVLDDQDFRERIVQKGRQTISAYLDFREEDRYELIAKCIIEAYEKRFKI
jgi:glycosyltransferase involved in cell wall biosynthesis